MPAAPAVSYVGQCLPILWARYLNARPNSKQVTKMHQYGLRQFADALGTLAVEKDP